MHKQKVAQYLNLLDRQRDSFFTSVESITRDALWKRPAADAWSIGEHIAHTRILLRSMRRMFTVLWPFLFPLAWLRRKKPFHAHIDDVYKRPKFPLQAGWFWSPRGYAKKPVCLKVLRLHLAREHQAVRTFYQDKEERVLGNCCLYDPAIGWINLVQALRVGAYHDQHHFQQAKEMWAGKQ